MDFENEKTVKLQVGEAASLTVKSPEEQLFYFVFVCRGSKAAYKQIEEYIKAKTPARLIFQRLSQNYLSVSEIRLKPIKEAAK